MPRGRPRRLTSERGWWAAFIGCWLLLIGGCAVCAGSKALPWPLQIAAFAATVFFGALAAQLYRDHPRRRARELAEIELLQGLAAEQEHRNRADMGLGTNGRRPPKARR